MLFLKVKSTHTRRILCRVSGLVSTDAAGLGECDGTIAGAATSASVGDADTVTAASTEDADSATAASAGNADTAAAASAGATQEARSKRRCSIDLCGDDSALFTYMCSVNWGRNDRKRWVR